MTVAESTIEAVEITFASNFSASGSAYTIGTYSVPDGSAIVVVTGNNSFSSSDISSVVIADTGSHTWTFLTPTYDDVNMPFVVAYWHNTTGVSVNITPTAALTYTNNRTLGFTVHLISGDNGSPSTLTTVTTGVTSTSDIEASAVPTVTGSLFALHYVHQEASASASSLVSGTTGDTSPAGYGQSGSGSNGMGLGTLYQSAANTQTSSPETVGAAAPTDGFLFAVLVEYQPAPSGIWGGSVGTASAAGTPGVFSGSITGGFTGVVAAAAAAGIPGTFTGAVPTTVTEATVRAAAISYASNFSASGTTGSFGTFTVPDGATIVAVSGANDDNVTAIAVSDAAGHVWDRIVGYDPDTMPLAVDIWHNNTGTSVPVALQLAPTYTFNKTIGLGVYIINGCGASPIIKATITGATTTPEASGTPTVDGSLFCLHYLQQAPGAVASAFNSGTTGDLTAGGYGIGNAGTDMMGLGTLYQTADNAQTSSPVTVGAAAPSATTFAVLVEYVPSGASIGAAFTGTVGTATAAGVPGVFEGTDFVGAVGTAIAAGVSGTFEGTTIVTGPLATATAAGIPGTFTGNSFIGGGFTGVPGHVAAAGVPGVFTSGDSWTGTVGTVTARGIPGTFSTTAVPERNITITIGPITGGWTVDTADGGWTAELPNGGWAVGSAATGWADGGITA